jgi:prepilin-type N-terminal cleavage/methylation domain-containing protein
MTRRHAFSLIEVLIAAGLLGVVIGAVYYMFAFGTRATGRLTPQLSLQQASRKAVVRLLRELQEGMEVVSPSPGSTLSYAIIRDKLSRARWFYLVEKRKTPTPVMELWRYVDDLTIPREQRTERMLEDVRRLTFTSRGEGALQVNLLLAEGEQEYALLTTVRLRNIASAEEVW